LGSGCWWRCRSPRLEAREPQERKGQPAEVRLEGEAGQGDWREVPAAAVAAEEVPPIRSWQSLTPTTTA